VASVNLDSIYRKLPTIQGRNELIASTQTTRDIINAVLQQHNTNVEQAKKIAHYFDSKDPYDVCRKIWNFLKYQIPYNVEPSAKQTAKTLSRIVHDAKHGSGKNDCKHYSGFTAAILDCLRIPFVFRFAGYSKYSNVPTHVYCVAYPGTSDEIIIDAVLNNFDTEKPYTLKIDKKPKNNMALYKLSGIDDPQNAEIGGILKKIKNAGKKAVNAVKKAGQSAGKAVVAVAKQVKKGAFTMSFAVPRNAFLLLLRFNVHGWATGLSRMNFDRLVWWRDWFGGNRTDLMNAIREGAKRKRILGISNDDVLFESDKIGVEPTTTAAALASATPIIVKVTNVLKEAEKISNQVEGITSAVDKTSSAIKTAKDGFKQITGKNPEDLIFSKDSESKNDQNKISQNDLKRPTDEQAMQIAKMATSGRSGGINKMYLIGGAALIGVLFLTNKKR
jgi:hypothetical protein